MYDYTFKVTLFGKPSENRTRLMQSFRFFENSAKTKRSNGFDFAPKVGYVNGEQYKLIVWNILCEERFRSIIPTYIQGVSGGIFTYDVNIPSSLICIYYWLPLIKKALRKNDTFPIMIAGLITDKEEDRRVSSEVAIQIAKANDVAGYVECHPEREESVENLFQVLIELMIEYKYARYTNSIKDSIDKNRT